VRARSRRMGASILRRDGKATPGPHDFRDRERSAKRLCRRAIRARSRSAMRHAYDDSSSRNAARSRNPARLVAACCVDGRHHRLVGELASSPRRGQTVRSKQQERAPQPSADDALLGASRLRAPRCVAATSAVLVTMGVVSAGGAARGGARAAPQRSPDLAEPYTDPRPGSGGAGCERAYRRGRAPAHGAMISTCLVPARPTRSAPRDAAAREAGGRRDRPVP